MAATIGAWLASQGASLLLGFLAKLIHEFWQDYQDEQARKAAARAEITSVINKQTAETVDAINTAAANHPADSDVAGRLSRGQF